MRVGVMERPEPVGGAHRRDLLAGEPFDFWVRKSRDTLFATLMRILRDETEAEDILQDTYLRAYTRLGSFRGESDPIGWLRRIAVRLALNRIRARKLRRWLPLSFGSPEEGLQPPDSGPLPDADAALAQQRARLEALIEELPAKARVAFSLRVLDDRPYDEIAEAVGCSEATARSLVSRSRSRLEAEIQERGWNDE